MLNAKKVGWNESILCEDKHGHLGKVSQLYRGKTRTNTGEEYKRTSSEKNSWEVKECGNSKRDSR